MILAGLDDIPDAEARAIVGRIREAAKRPEPRAVFEADVPLVAGGRRLVDHPDFEAAKAGDIAAARRLAPELLDETLLARITASLPEAPGDAPLIIAFARRDVGSQGGNAIPQALAERISERLGGRAVRFVQTGAKQRGAGAAERVMSEPAFAGEIVPGARYLLVDDYLTLGSTMQNLRSAIAAEGGDVVGAATLGKSRFTASFAPQAATLAKLRTKFPGLEADWRALTGAPFDALTDAEARYLLGFADEGALKERPLAGHRPAGGDVVRAAAPESDLFLLSPTGRRFLEGPDGTAKLGTVPAFEGAPHGSGDVGVRLSRGDIKHLDTQVKRSEAQAAGYSDGLDLAVDVASIFTEIRQGHSGRLMLAKPNGHAKIAVVELTRDEEGYYRIVTSGFRDLEKGDVGDVLWRKVREPSASAAGQSSPLLASPLDAGAAQQFASGQSTPSTVQPSRVAINWARIDGPDDIKLAMQQLADARAGEIDAARRGVRSHAETAAEAGRTDAWSVLMERRASGQAAPLNAEQSLAARQLWASSAETLTETAARAAANPTEANIFAFRKMLATHYAIQQEVIAARTETARALNAWKIPAGPTGEKMRAIQAALAETGGADFHRELAKRLAAFQGNEGAMARQLDEVVRGTIGARTRDAMLQAWINGLLSGPQTHIVNMMSNTAVAFHSISERAAAARLALALGTDGGVELGEATAQMFGMIEGLKDALRIGGAGRRWGSVWRNLATGESAVGGSKIDVTTQGRPPPISSAAWGVAQDSGLGKGLDLLGTVVDLPSRALGAEDELFKTIGYRMELHAQALRRASAEVRAGRAPEAELKGRIAEIVADPPEDIRLAALDQAALQTFTNPLGAPGQAALRLVNTAWPLRVVVPFVRTPANIFRYVTERTPLAPLAQQWRADIAAGGARRDLALARTALGSMILLAGIDMARTGAVTGRAPREPGEREQFLRTKQAYSVRIGDRWYAYNRLDPLGMTLGIAADLAATFDNADLDADFEEDALKTVASTQLSPPTRSTQSAVSRSWEPPPT